MQDLSMLAVSGTIIMLLLGVIGFLLRIGYNSLVGTDNDIKKDVVTLYGGLKKTDQNVAVVDTKLESIHELVKEVRDDVKEIIKK